MTELLANLGQFGTHALTTAGNVVDFVVSNPICLLGTSFFLLGGIVSMVKRLISVA